MTQTAVADKEHVRKEAGARNPLLATWHSVIGKKIVMAVTGAVLVLFVLAHMAGNLKIFAGADMINAYSRSLREMAVPELGYGQLLWIVRIVLLTCALLHITAAVPADAHELAGAPGWLRHQERCRNHLGRADHALGRRARSLIFIVFHMLHFTLGVVGFQPGQFEHLMVYQNVVAGFSVWPIAVFYIIAMAALCLHLDHGIWSMLADAGLGTAGNTKSLRIISRIVAIDHICSDLSRCRFPCWRAGCAERERDARIEDSIRSDRKEVGESPASK